MPQSIKITVYYTETENGHAKHSGVSEATLEEAWRAFARLQIAYFTAWVLPV